ncbi:hypothetical protein O6P43_032420 [Quillaja saponaria]|uniref:Uncharacterized protein n=1 Tax=Quillaja saponaria TaxID=32244 RepID=A0AAD7KPE6_QUISA|nr:hypothetical protein O6P43_032420 [Quillaja saponaria]
MKEVKARIQPKAETNAENVRKTQNRGKEEVKFPQKDDVAINEVAEANSVEVDSLVAKGKVDLAEVDNLAEAVGIDSIKGDDHEITIIVNPCEYGDLEEGVKEP